ncbi:MAG: CDP-glycerol glycerophosphotransferase family protein [Bacillaceae bacterium]
MSSNIDEIESVSEEVVRDIRMYFKKMGLTGSIEEICKQIKQVPTLMEEYKLFVSLINKQYYHEALEVLRAQAQLKEHENKIKNYEEYINKYNHFSSKKLYQVCIALRKRIEIWNRNLKENTYKATVLLLAYVIRFLYGREIWLIGERPSQAEDNGYEFFKYCRENDPKKKIFYVITKDSIHVDKVKKYKTIIYHSSLKHKAFLLAATKYISAWTTNESLMPNDKKEFKKLFGPYLKDKKNVCLQHGMIVHNISPYMHSDIYEIDYVFCSSAKEKEIIKNTLGYKDNQVIVTGLARFDNLHTFSVEKQILMMPTWRRPLARNDKGLFKKSEFFNRYNRLLNNQQLIALLEKHDMTLIFYLHYNFQVFEELFQINTNRIKVINKEKANVADLLKSSQILVTDYSSVATDFVYMKKPVLLYQFDPHHNHHTEVDEIKYEELGQVIQEEDMLVQQLEDIMDGNLPQEQLEAKCYQLFGTIDNQNRKRIYEHINRM